jgi:tRNA (guanine-N7-)-methyltransferase
MRTLAREKVPAPRFSYDIFHQWRSAQIGPFAIEIGCGVGLHPIQWAKTNPLSHILAIERTKEKFARFSSRLLHHPQLQNIFPAHADASQLLPHLVQDESVDEYFVLYPNPYPKARHKNRRFAHSPFSLFLAKTLKKGGRLSVATNDLSYADELRIHLPPRTELKLLADELIPCHSLPRSHFEKKYLARGEPCFNLVFSR